MVGEVKILQDLGLTLTQSKVYLALRKFGNLDTKQIAKFAAMSRPDVYRVLENLETKGLVEKTISKPVRYNVVSSNNRLKLLLEKKKKGITKLESDLQTLLKKLEKNSKVQFQKKDFQTVIVSGKENLILKIKKTITDSQETLCCLGSHKKIAMALFSFAELLIKAINRGVKVKIVTGENDGAKLVPNILADYIKGKKPLLEIRYVKKQLEAHILVIDRKQVLVNTSIQTGLAESPAVWSNNPCIVALNQNYFDILWLTSTKDQEHKIDGILI